MIGPVVCVFVLSSAALILDLEILMLAWDSGLPPLRTINSGVDSCTIPITFGECFLSVVSRHHLQVEQERKLTLILLWRRWRRLHHCARNHRHCIAMIAAFL